MPVGLTKDFSHTIFFSSRTLAIYRERWINALNVLQIWAVVSFAGPSDKTGYVAQQRTLFYANQINC